MGEERVTRDEPMAKERLRRRLEASVLGIAHPRPRGRDPSGQHQGPMPLAGADFLSMRRVLVLHFQPIRFDRFDRVRESRTSGVGACQTISNPESSDFFVSGWSPGETLG